MKTIKYNIISSQRRDRMVESVNDEIRKGWQPIGGVVVENGFYFQAMVKHEEKP